MHFMNDFDIHQETPTMTYNASDVATDLNLAIEQVLARHGVPTTQSALDTAAYTALHEATAAEPPKRKR